jgi:ribonuclease HI
VSGVWAYGAVQKILHAAIVATVIKDHIFQGLTFTHKMHQSQTTDDRADFSCVLHALQSLAQRRDEG